jgi:dihydrofolate synthase/folylpolyglutamate synthase
VIAAVAARQAATLIDATESVSVSVSARDWEGQTLRITTQEEAFKPIRLPLVGAYQVENVCTAMATLTCIAQQGLAIPSDAYARGLSTVCWPGRFQVVRRDPILIVDGAHNPDGATALCEALHALNKGKTKRKVALIAGFCGDKDVLSYLRVLASTVHCAWAVPVPNPRSLTADETAGKMRMAGIDDVQACATLPDAVAAAETWAKTQDGLIVICGSLFLAGAALEQLNAFPWSQDRHDLAEQLKA